LVTRDLAKVETAGSSPVYRSLRWASCFGRALFASPYQSINKTMHLLFSPFCGKSAILRRAKQKQRS